MQNNEMHYSALTTEDLYPPTQDTIVLGFSMVANKGRQFPKNRKTVTAKPFIPTTNVPQLLTQPYQPETYDTEEEEEDDLGSVDYQADGTHECENGKSFSVLKHGKMLLSITTDNLDESSVSIFFVYSCMIILMLF
jgi:hypothetical protein